MPKHPRKRQKTSKAAAEVVPLGTHMLLDDDSKDDEERRLESMLFGTKYVPRGDGSGAKGAVKDLAVEYEEEAGQELQHLLNEDLFFVDDATSHVDISNQLDVSSTQDDEASEASEDSEDEYSSSEDSGSESSDSSPSITSSRSSSIQPTTATSKKPKPPAWLDPTDRLPTASISLLSGPSRLRKLRNDPDEDSITAKEYEVRLRRQYERINPQPSWASQARKKNAEEREKELQEGDEEWLNSTEGILAKKSARKGRKTVIEAGSLNIERLRDANQSVQGKGSGTVSVVAFHPSGRIPVLCVATEGDRRIRLFNVDGHLNPLLHTLHIPSLPSPHPTFHPLGSSLLITGTRPFFYTHDLQSETTTKHSRGLWGISFDDVHSSRKRSRNGKEAGADGGPSTSIPLHTAFSPTTGSMLAVAGKGGNVHIVDWKNGSSRQAVASLKCAGGGSVQGMWWVPSSSGGDESMVLGDSTQNYAEDRDHNLAVLTSDSEIYIWDVGSRRCVRRWRDEGGFRGAGKVLAGSSNSAGNGWMAVGSNTGLVNVYTGDSFAAHLSSTFSSSEAFSTISNPKPVKTITNLTTAISTLRFNHDAQVMAIASKEKKDSLRLIHLPSLTSFSNWPTSSTPLGHVTAVDFSAQSEYVAIGNTRGRVLLYHLKDYGVGAGGAYSAATVK